MFKQIVVDARRNQVRVAVMEDGDLAEFYMEEDNKRVLGNIYRGRITNVLPGMQAAFVDIGLDKNAFLYLGDIKSGKLAFEFAEAGNPAEEYIRGPFNCGMFREGQEITVQVLKEPIGTKGARVTTHITLPGRYLVLMPTSNYIGISRRIEDEGERQRLKEIAQKIKPEGMGLIVRTAAQGRGEEDFLSDIDFLCRLWRKIKEYETEGEVPRVLYKDGSLLYRTVRDLFTDDIDCFVINNQKEYNKVLELVDVISPSLKERVEYFEADLDIFDYYGINSKIERAIQKKVWLKNGGYIVIEATEALTVIDVNTGKFVGEIDLEDTVLKTNLEAAEEIAHQIRLRDIGGIIIIDFIDMKSEENKQKVLEVLNRELKKDRTKTRVVGFTGLGLVEMTRKKVRKRLTSVFLKPCPYCHGTGKIYSESMILARIENELTSLFRNNEIWGALVEVHPSIASYWADTNCREFDVLESCFNKTIYVRGDPGLHVEEIRIRPIEGQEELEGILLEYADSNQLIEMKYNKRRKKAD